MQKDKTPAQIVRSACIFAYCLSYSAFLNIFRLADDKYASSKYEAMQTDFSKWFCKLDGHNARRFMDALQEAEDEDN
jgi:hypothetical protein